MFLFIWYLKLLKLGASFISDERSFHYLIGEGKTIYNTILFLKKVGVNSKRHVNYIQLYFQ